MMEGRQQVKTRTEKSPFNRINNQAAGDVGGFSGNFKGQQSSRGGQLTLSGAQHQCYSAATENEEMIIAVNAIYAIA